MKRVTFAVKAGAGAGAEALVRILLGGDMSTFGALGLQGLEFAVLLLYGRRRSIVRSAQREYKLDRYAHGRRHAVLSDAWEVDREGDEMRKQVPVMWIFFDDALGSNYTQCKERIEPRLTRSS